MNFLFGHLLNFLKFQNNPFKWAAKVIFISLNNRSFVIYLSWGKLHMLLLLNISTDGFFIKTELFSIIQIRDKRQNDALYLNFETH